MSAEHTEVYKGHRIQIFQDTDIQNPRTEYDNLGKMICFHSRYTLGDKHDFGSPDDLFEELCGRLPNREAHHPVTELLGDGSEFRIVWEPLYLYDHSGITMSTKPFSCRWDSGQVGIIYVTYDDIAKSMNVQWKGEGKWVPSAEIIAQHEKILQGEVSTYDDYIRGNCYGYRVFEMDEEYVKSEDEDADPDSDDYWCSDEVDSCWGFLGDYNSEGGALEAAKEYVDAATDKD